MKSKTRGLSLLFAVLCSLSSPLFADEVKVAVASNFAPLLKQLAAGFEKTSGHTVVLSSGATGRLYTQIANGAPFDVFFAADNEKPEQLVNEKKAVAGTVFTYAIGKLVLWSPALNLSMNADATLKQATFNHLALANPKLAPYGAAAQQVLTKLQLWDALQNKLVLGENIAQALQFVDSGNAELGFIALAQWQELPADKRGKPWLIPPEMHAPITQDAVILHDSTAARAFMTFMQSSTATIAIQQAGYSLP
ncbi:MAG TPA: molybdate ABC transporter substrate-binding protein [Candidatus Acidoferrum sp.]|nr:molybdate ABC transporter substrate-binding protein [Candidatus Acidoferrum sp.]